MVHLLALAVLLLSLIPNQTLRGIVNLSWVVMLIVVIADTSFTVFRIKRALSAEFPTLRIVGARRCTPS